MKCVICNGEDIREQNVDEELRSDKDIVLAPVTCLVCQSCGERYYDTATMKDLEHLRADLREGKLALKQVGKVMLVQSAFAKAA
jgi:YgiT-type zinc finger domain-containing protein